MGPYQRTPREVAGAIRYSGLGVRSVGPVGDLLYIYIYSFFWIAKRIEATILKQKNATPLLSQNATIQRPRFNTATIDFGKKYMDREK